MVFRDLLKHQSLSSISVRFVQSIGKKYNNKITIGEYIVERFNYKNINVAFRYKHDDYTPFLKVASRNDKFNIIFNNHVESVGYCALSYAQLTNNIGIILKSPHVDFANISKSVKDAYYNNIPLLLLSFYYPEFELKFEKSVHFERKFIKESYTVTKPDKFPNILEYMMMIAEIPQKGSVHLNIDNNILDNMVNLDDINLDKREDDKWYKDDAFAPNKDPDLELDLEDHSLLKHYEKHYEQIEP